MPGRDTAPGFSLRRLLLRPADCCAFATWVRFRKMTEDERRASETPRDPPLSPRKCCRYNDLVALCRVFGRASGGSGHWGDRSELY